MMSFSGDVKEELGTRIGTSRHCQLAELAALFCFDGKIVQNEDGHTFVSFRSENRLVLDKCFTLLQKTFNMNLDMEAQSRYQFTIADVELNYRILQALRMLNQQGEPVSNQGQVSELLIKNSCCQRAFLRGAFLAAGSMSDPGKSYHLEYVCDTMLQAQQLNREIASFEINAKIIKRKNHYVVYIKEGAGIVDLLNVIEATTALLKLEELRVTKEVGNTVNRRVNCETANLIKTVNASTRQIADILYLQERVGLTHLPDSLRQMAEVRLEYPDAPLKELGDYLAPPVGKSGVHHRLKKLSELAEQMRGSTEKEKFDDQERSNCTN